VKLSLSKCWQTIDGRLVFQCSSFHDGKRQKGYLILNASRQDPVSFQSAKPDTELIAHGVAAIIRKYAPTSQLEALAISADTQDQKFLRLKLSTHAATKSGAGDPASLYVAICTEPERQIDIILNGLSQARLRPNAQYTIKKMADADILGAADLESDAFSYWLQDLLSENRHHTNTHSTGIQLPEWRKIARDRAARRLKTLKKTLAQDERKCPTDQAVTEAEESARLLQAYLWMVKPDMTALHLDETLAGGRALTIDIDPDKNPGANLERLFARAKKLRRAKQLQAPRLKEIMTDITRHNHVLARLRDANQHLTETDAAALLAELGLASKKPPSALPKTPSKKHNIGRRFMTLDQALITIGRDATESDQVVKSASAKDWWVHIAGGGHGSHAIITGASTRQGLSAETFRDAAILALHFSDRSRANEGEVYVARRQQIKKRKGMPPGLWLIERAETKIVRYSAEEVSAVFARELRDGLQREAARHGNSQ
jgi:predicted ribosome quality control (RQC) complex YloA/Tae2 family protein